ncbi:MAG: MucR family transcriptional regulator [Syntrophales bacterium]|nr:MucR family transcriptional regulator [Syntrophorhabdaceae bacterium]
MAELIQLAAEIVMAHASATEMTSEDLQNEIKAVYATLKGLETGDVSSKPALTLRQAFKKDEVACMVCGKTGLTTLKRHLAVAHDMKPGQYRKQFNIPSSQPLAAKDYVEKRRQMALDKGLAGNLEKARAARKAKPKKVVKAKAKPVVKAKAKPKKAAKAKK